MKRGLRKRYGRAKPGVDTGASYGSVSPPRRVEILNAGDGPSGYWKKGQYGYVVSYSRRGGEICMDRPYRGPGSMEAKPGEVSYLVSKSSHGRGGALWFSENAVRFTGRKS